MQKLIVLTASLLACFSLSCQAEEAAANAFTLNTNAFLDTGPIPVLYTCDGKDMSPELDWVNLPPKTQSLAIIVSDPTAPQGLFYHWVVYNIPASVTTIPETSTTLPAGAMAAKNSFGKLQYNGPCPPKGSVHTYAIDLYALNSKLNVPTNADDKSVMQEIKKHMIAKTGLTFVYSRWLK